MTAQPIINKSNQQPGTSGFTLIELMVVIAIVGILAAVAYPTYTAHIKTGNITEATTTLSQKAIDLERHFQDNKNYGSSATVNAWACGTAAPSAGKFTYTCNWGSGGTNESFLITATGNAASGMSDYTYTIDHNNAKQTTAFLAKPRRKTVGSGRRGNPANA